MRSSRRSNRRSRKTKRIKKIKTRRKHGPRKTRTSTNDLKRYIDNNMIKRDKYINKQSSFNGGDDDMMALDFQKKIDNYSKILKERGTIYPVNDVVGEKFMAENS